MFRILSATQKEWLILRRDWPGLAMIYLMPMVLVLVVSIVQEGAFKALKENKIKMLLIDRDQGPIGKTLVAGLRRSRFFVLQTTLDGKIPDANQIRQVVSKGRYLVGIEIPKGTSMRAARRAKKMAMGVLARSRPGAPPSPKKTSPSQTTKRQLLKLRVYFDPTIRASFRNAVVTSLRRFSEKIEIRTVLSAVLKGYSDALPGELRRCMQQIMGKDAAGADTPKTPSLKFPWGKTRLFGIDQVVALEDSSRKIPTSVQQNVPAWTLFAMFFIVIPLSSNLIREREQGTLMRLQTMPVSPIMLFMSKALVYTLVCLSQLALMLLMGKTLLPWLGTPVLEIGSNLLAVGIVGLCSALAAIGFGMLLGLVSRTQEQAAMIGAITIVIGAAIGGLMVPTFVMPPLLQKVSMLSPLGWGLDAFIDLFVRGGGFATIWRNLLLLFGFFLVTMVISLGFFFRRP